MSLYVVTGTDTGVGKTFVATALVSELRRRGADAVGIKPVETGWDEPTSDARRLATASGRSLESTIWARFDLPAAPAVAAAAVSTEIHTKDLVSWIRTAAAQHAFCFVEGAGGWMVPINNDHLFCDAVEKLRPAGVILVSASRLGTINHTLLTAEAVERVAPLKAVALSVRPSDASEEAASNLEEIRKRVAVPVLSVPTQIGALADLFHVEHRG